MYEELTTKLLNTLNGIAKVKQVLMDPRSKITGFPAVYVNFDGGDGSFATTQENMNIVRFRMSIIIALAGVSAQDANQTILPKTADAIKEAFDTNWDQGTIDGHRVWVELTDLTAPSIVQMQDGDALVADMGGQFKLLSTN